MGTFYSAVNRSLVYVDVAHAYDIYLQYGKDATNFLKRNDLEALTAASWDHIEVAYFRAAACWDRIGQLLDFVFFNVRDYREGFAETVKKLKANFDKEDLPVRRIRQSDDWVFVSQFEARDHGKLTSKRNALTHRVSAGPSPFTHTVQSNDARVRFVPYMDHLEFAMNRFGPSPEEELAA
jgi:hypothetical protein